MINKCIVVKIGLNRGTQKRKLRQKNLNKTKIKEFINFLEIGVIYKFWGNRGMPPAASRSSDYVCMFRLASDITDILASGELLMATMQKKMKIHTRATC